MLSPRGDLSRMHSVGTGQPVNGFLPFEGCQRHPDFKFRAVAFPLCRHPSSPHQSHFDPALYLKYLSSFGGYIILRNQTQLQPNKISSTPISKVEN